MSKKQKNKKKSSDANQDHQPYDKTLKRVFSQPVMVESLIKGFVPDPWAKELNFFNLEEVNVKHATDDLRTRDNDIIWRIDFRNHPLFIILILEFQSSIDKHMAVRLLTYAGLAYQDLLNQGETVLLENEYLPPVFSMVFYTGLSRWSAPISRLSDPN